MDSADTRALVEALAARLEEALPRLAAVRRRRVGGFRSRRTEVERIEVALGEERFELIADRGGLQCLRHRVVRGITLRREELPMAQWLAELVERVTATAAVGEQARSTLQGLLT